jgi:predicted nucleotidyltransferase
MRLEHYPAEKLKQEIVRIIGRHLDIGKYRVFFFGSRVNGLADERSDVDIGVEGPAIPSGAWVDIQEEVEDLPTLYKVELVDFGRVDDTFREVALQHTEDISVPVAK